MATTGKQNSVKQHAEHVSLVRLDSVILDVRLDEILAVLNNATTSQAWHSFFARDQIDDRVSALRLLSSEELAVAWRAQRAEAAEALRSWVSEWIASGMDKGGRQCARWRAIERSPLAASAESRFWQQTRIQPERVGELLHLRTEAGGEFSFDFANWKAHRALAAILRSNLRTRIAKCGYSKCSQYFLLNERQETHWFSGATFCSLTHRRRATAKASVESTRAVHEKKLIERAAQFLAKAGAPPRSWKEDKRFKKTMAADLQRFSDREHLYTHERVTANWVTRHEKAISEQQLKRR